METDLNNPYSNGHGDPVGEPGPIGEHGINYYDVGTREDIVVSNSSLSYINPEQGGSPQKFLSFFDKQEEKQESKSLENGRIVHLYAEKPDEFAVASVAKPDGMIGKMADEFYRLKRITEIPANNTLITAGALMQVGFHNIDCNITSDLKTEGGRQSEILSVQAAYEKLAALLSLDVTLTIGITRMARENTESYKSYKEDTLVNKFIAECIDYLKQAEKLQGKLTLTASQKEIIENCIKSLKGNPLANKYFNLGGGFVENAFIFRELDVYFELMGLKVKAKLDNIYIDILAKKIYLNDLKTTAKPLSSFQEILEYYKYHRQLAFYLRALRWLINNGYFNYLNIPDLHHFEVVPQIIAVETTGNFDSDVFLLDGFYVDKGTKEAKSLMERVLFHKTNNNWTKSMESIQNGGVIKLTPKI